MASNTYPSGGYSRIFPATVGAPKATVTGTTGSPTIDTVSRAGKTIYKFTGSGSITIGQAGTCEVFLAGGGGAGNFAGPVVGSTAPSGGAGGYLYTVDAFLPAATLTVTVGAGGAAGGNVGNGSLIGSQYYASGGGGVGALQTGLTNNLGAAHGAGGSGAGGFGSALSASGGAALGGGIGFAGGNGFFVGAGSTSNAAGGGGGAGGAGGNASSGVNGTAGAGLANSITGASVTYCAGQAGGSGTSGTANSGGAGGGAGGTPTGGSGVVIVVVG